MDFLKEITCDARGYLYVGTWNSKVLIIDAGYINDQSISIQSIQIFFHFMIFRTGEEADKITFPCMQISGLCFAEKKYDVLYITTAAFAGNGQQSIQAGRLFYSRSLNHDDRNLNISHSIFTVE